MSDYIITQIRQVDKYGNHLVDELLAAEGIRRDANLDYTCGMYDDEMIDNGFSVKSHKMDGFHILTESFHVVKVCINRIKTLYSCCSCRDHKILSRTHQLDSCSCNVCLKIFCVITAGTVSYTHLTLPTILRV